MVPTLCLQKCLNSDMQGKPWGEPHLKIIEVITLIKFVDTWITL